MLFIWTKCCCGGVEEITTITMVGQSEVIIEGQNCTGFYNGQTASFSATNITGVRFDYSYDGQYKYGATFWIPKCGYYERLWGSEVDMGSLWTNSTSNEIALKYVTSSRLPNNTICLGLYMIGNGFTISLKNNTLSITSLGAYNTYSTSSYPPPATLYAYVYGVK